MNAFVASMFDLREKISLFEAFLAEKHVKMSVAGLKLPTSRM
jgi:hypothetical protein